MALSSSRESMPVVRIEDLEATEAPPIVTAVDTLPPEDANTIVAIGILREFLLRGVRYCEHNIVALNALMDFKWRKYAKRLWTQKLVQDGLVSLSFTFYCLLLWLKESKSWNSEQEKEESLNLESIALLVSWLLAVPCLFRDFTHSVTWNRSHGQPGSGNLLRSGWISLRLLASYNLVFMVPNGHFTRLNEESKKAFYFAFLGTEAFLLWTYMLCCLIVFRSKKTLITTFSVIVEEIVSVLLITLCMMCLAALYFRSVYHHVEFTEGIAMNDSPLGSADTSQTDGGDEKAQSMYKAFGTFKRSFYTVFGYTFGIIDWEILLNAPKPFAALALFVLYEGAIIFIIYSMIRAFKDAWIARIHGKKMHPLRYTEERVDAIEHIDSLLSDKQKNELRDKHGRYLHIVIPTLHRDVYVDVI